MTDNVVKGALETVSGGVGGFFTSLIKPVADVGSQYLRHRAAEKEAESEERIARLKARAKRWEQESEQSHDLDSKAADARRYSFKDEAITYTILALLWITATAPFVEIKYPGHIARVKEMWQMLQNDVPQEFWIAFGLLFVAIFGFRGLLNRWMDLKQGVKSLLPGSTRAAAQQSHNSNNTTEKTQ